MKSATETLPTLLSDLTTGVTLSDIERAAAENGLFLGRQGWGTVRVELNGDSIGLIPVHSENICGLYFKHNGQIFQGKGLLFGENSPLKDFPILGILL